MGYVTASTSWPASIHSPVKELVDRLYTIADTPDPNSGGDLAKIFTKDGKFYAPGQVFSGTEELEGCRREAWKTAAARRHEVFRVYINDAQDPKLVILGELTITATDGSKNTHQFAGQLALKKVGDDEYKIAQYEIWVVGHFAN